MSPSSPFVQTNSMSDDWGTKPDDSRNELSLQTFSVMNEIDGSGCEGLAWLLGIYCDSIDRTMDQAEHWGSSFSIGLQDRVNLIGYLALLLFEIAYFRRRQDPYKYTFDLLISYFKRLDIQKFRTLLVKAFAFHFFSRR
ncbi:hypothetical protein Tco_1212335 [Tanacetum coccineum]